MAIQAYLNDFSSALNRDDGQTLAELLSVRNRVGNSLLQASDATFNRFNAPWDEVLLSHVNMLRAFTQRDVVSAAEHENMLLQYVSLHYSLYRC